ncbi:MAG: hypothetical protein ACAI43_01410 [Phycisphaerae bacterium]|nr:hypothetical protein [Tepidisphaeraceae bacterium]
MVKFAQYMLAAVFAVGACTMVSAEEKKEAPKFTAGSCCDKAAKAGEKCKHPCCVAATEKGEVCAKCNKPKKEAAK